MRKIKANVKTYIRMKRQAYKPQPAKRKYTYQAGNDKKRPLGIPAMKIN